MKRYNDCLGGTTSRMVVAVIGEWCRYTDVQAEIDRLGKTITALREAEKLPFLMKCAAVAGKPLELMLLIQVIVNYDAETRRMGGR